MSKGSQCGSCKFFDQGKTCSFCGNPEQTNRDFKSYVYYTFGCELHEDGIAQSRVDYMEKLRKVENVKAVKKK